VAMYLVKVREVYVQEVFIEASSEEEALDMVEDGEGFCGDHYYDEVTLERGTWDVGLIT
jgi:hypothetical protein